jgi:hypothetical protein
MIKPYIEGRKCDKKRDYSGTKSVNKRKGIKPFLPNPLNLLVELKGIEPSTP